jgi:hypothetical protein
MLIFMIDKALNQFYYLPILLIVMLKHNRSGFALHCWIMVK